MREIDKDVGSLCANTRGKFWDLGLCWEPQVLLFLGKIVFCLGVEAWIEIQIHLQVGRSASGC